MQNVQCIYIVYANSIGADYLRTQNPYEEVKGLNAVQTAVILSNNYILGIKYYANVQCVYIVNAKYQIQTAKALVQVESPEKIKSK